MKITCQKLLFLPLIFLIFGCYEPKEGCLEINASNFDVEADEPCENCCELPNLTIAVLNRLTDTMGNDAFKTGTPYPFQGDTNHIFQINRIHFYLSDIQLITNEDKIITSNDSSEIFVIDSANDTVETFIKNDIAYFERSRINSENLGNFLPGGSYKKVSFKFGIPDDLTNTFAPKTSSGHPLGYQSDSLNWDADDGYLFCRIDLVRDTSINDSSGADSVTVIKITNPDVFNIDLADDFELKSGFDTKISLRVNFLDWFENVDLEEDSELTIKNKILENIPASFSLEPAEQ